jgi:hypothetical protein
MEYYSQTSLDEYYTLDEYLERETVEVEDETVGEPDTKPSKCNYCVLKNVKKYILHPGSIFLYVKDGKLKALADINHVYHKCREGLIDNIVFLYRVMCELRSNGYNVLVVGKAFDDDLNSINDFEKMDWYMQYVGDEAVREAVSIVEEHVIT